jgi:hypothetical protein
MTSLLLLSLVVLAADVPHWEQSAEVDGIKIFARQRPDAEVREMKAVSLLDATPYEIWGAIRDYDNYTKTMPYTVEAKVLSREQGGKLIYFYSRLDMPLVSSRDYIIKIVDESAWKDGVGFLKASWTAANDKDALMPLKEGVVRVRINDGYWLLEPWKDGKKTLATYYLYTSPGGSIPSWIANKANGIAVPKVFLAIMKIVAGRQKAGK